MFTKIILAFACFLFACLVGLFACFTVLAKFKSPKIEQTVENKAILSKESTQPSRLLSADESTQNLDEMKIKSEKVSTSSSENALEVILVSSRNPESNSDPRQRAGRQARTTDSGQDPSDGSGQNDEELSSSKASEKEDLDSLFSKYSAEYGVDEGLLRKIARCESHFNPGAVNGPYGGMYQFVSGTWVSSRSAMGLDPNPALRFDAQESIKTAAFKIARDGSAAWPVCRWR